MTQNDVWRWMCIGTVLSFASMLLVLGMEWIQRGTLEEALTWLFVNPSLFFLNAFIVFLALSAVYALVGSLIPSAAITALLVFVASMISYFKTKLIGEPFFPWDLLLNKEGLNVVSLVSGKAMWVRVGLALAVVTGLFALRLIVPRLPLRLAPRLVLGFTAIAALYGFATDAGWSGRLMSRAGASEIVWDQQQNYGHNGLALAFTMNAKHTIVPKPPGYGEPAIAGIAQELKAGKEAVTAAAASPDPLQGTKPNVIFLMNEAFWDPTLLPDVYFREDPIPTVRRLQAESQSGYMLSPQFGGGTSNVEFEVLTGYSMSFLPAGSVPYQQYVKKPIPSLASYFEEQGYKSVGIHSYEGWFWDRTNVYGRMGFESFYSQEQFDNPVYRGNFIADSEVARKIMQVVDETEQPMFIYAVTMQNHGPYDDSRYPDDTPIDIEGDLTDEALSVLQTYAIGASDADASLQMLIDHFEQSGEPTVIVFYGDHLPMLGMGYDVYKQGGMIRSDRSDEWSLEERQRMHSVPFVMWSNFGGLSTETVPAISASFMGAYVLDALGMEKPAPFEWNWSVFRQTPGLLRNLVVDAGQKLYDSVPVSLAAVVDRYRLLQYDLLFGKRYLADYVGTAFLTKPPLPNYNADLPGRQGL
ncbi:hypothetical protein DLM86_25790 [Paenibacillus flagellatus]|uniref:Sulfatase N-terminal domain-containing protein n=2 Tax=Paenibacillus flagellatus TaxID=2211139 RepID=A0A2V5JY71_9BACL|nr:hypothetical protein DLM86_25790 [Paenibacillus flagellatus]